MQPIVNIALRAARRAGQIIVRAMDNLDRLNVEHKGRNDLVSEIDRQAEAAIVDTIQKAYPEHGILGEEGSALNPDSEFTWIIDPLDGTLNFLNGIPHFAVSIGVRKGRILEHGVIVDPVRNEEFTASRGTGAQLNGRRIRASSRQRLDGAITASGIPFNQLDAHHDTYAAVVHELTRVGGVMRRTGSAALDLAYVGAGRLDAFLQIGIKPWDMAAGTVIVREAGGFVSDIAGGDRFMKTGNVVAANGKVYRELMKTVLGVVKAEQDGLLAKG